MKTLDQIWYEYLDSDLSPQTTKELIWHIENDFDPLKAISMAADMGMKSLGPIMAKHLNNDDDFVRQITIGCLLGQLELPEYLEIGYKIAQNEPDQGVRSLAIFNIGNLLDLTDNDKLRYKVAKYLYEIITIDNEEYFEFRGDAYKSMLYALEIDDNEHPLVSQLDNNIDMNIVEDFRRKYKINEH